MAFRRLLLILVWVAGMSWTAQGKQLAVIADTANPTTNLTTAELVKMVNPLTQTWPDGRAIKLIVRDPSCADMQLVVHRLLAMTPDKRRRLCRRIEAQSYWQVLTMQWLSLFQPIEAQSASSICIHLPKM